MKNTKTINKQEFSRLMEVVLPLATPPQLAVAVSGGADSMALGLLAAQWVEARAGALTALIVDHGLRPESAEEARTVAGWLQARHIPAVILMPEQPLDTLPGNLQENAREARYGLMGDWCREHGVGDLLVAHHADDQLETLLMRLVRGSGLEGLCGMRPVSEYDGIRLLRPLLSVPKARLIATLERQQQAWAEDPTNASADYTRNRLRPIAAQLTAEGLDAGRIHRVVTNLQSANRYMEAQTDLFLQQYVTIYEEKESIEPPNATHTRHPERQRRILSAAKMEILRFAQDDSVDLTGVHYITPLDVWRTADPEIARRALLRLLKDVGGKQKSPRADTVQPVLEALQEGALQKPRTLAGCLLAPQVKSNRLCIVKEEGS